jgi:hypothetical protein
MARRHAVRQTGRAARRMLSEVSPTSGSPSFHCLETDIMTRSTSPLRASLLAAALGGALVISACGSMPMTSSPAPMAMATQTFRATLSAAAEVPSNASPGTGTLEASFDKGSSVLKWRVVYSGLTGPATMAHFHGPAMPGANAGVVVPFPSAASPAEGSATLTPAQVTDLMAGKWYVNVHTAQNPGGEIRGQVLAN